MSRPVATRIPRADLATVPEGMYVIDGETAILKQTNPYGRTYEGPHVKVAHVKSCNTDISGLSDDTRRKLNVCLREDGNPTMEGWVRADQLEIQDAAPVAAASRSAKYVCEACSKDLGTVVVSSKPVCPRCTSLCEVVPDGRVITDEEPMLKRLNHAIKMDRTIAAKMRIEINTRRANSKLEE